jgi:7-cyano-7-deazaguanine synthase in queuosine biosynthesis
MSDITLNLNGTELIIYDQPVGINVSGGADSALLLYFLMKHSQHTIYIFTLDSEFKQNRNSVIAQQVVAECSRLTGCINFVHRIDSVGVQDKINLWDLAARAQQNGEIEIVYSGVTANPPWEVLLSFKEPSSEAMFRDPLIARSVRADNIYGPWANIDKWNIGTMYKLNGLMDSLYPLTRSCEWSPNRIEQCPDPGPLAHCGHCWWCEERLWGFGRIK